MEAVSFVHAVDKFLHEFVVEWERTSAAGALKMVMIRLADPFEYGIARTEAGFCD